MIALPPALPPARPLQAPAMRTPVRSRFPLAHTPHLRTPTSQHKRPFEIPIRRSDEIIAGAAVFIGGIIWLALATRPTWIGWLLTAAGALLLARRFTRR